MIPTEESLAWLHIQILEQIRASHLATLGAVRAWATVAATASTESATHLWSSTAPGLPQFEGSPALYPGWREDPKDVVNSMFAFAHELLDLDRQFAHRLLLAGRAPAAPRPVEAHSESGARRRTKVADTAVTAGPDKTTEAAKSVELARGASTRRPRNATRVAKRPSKGATK